MTKSGFSKRLILFKCNMSDQIEHNHLAPRPDRSLSVHPAWREYPLIGARPSKGNMPEISDQEQETPLIKEKKGLADYNLKYAADLAAKYASQKIKIAKASMVLDRLTDIERDRKMQTVLTKKKQDQVPSIEGLFIINSNGLHIAPGAGPEQREQCNAMLARYVDLYG